MIKKEISDLMDVLQLSKTDLAILSARDLNLIAMP